jgi:hypothetical protein
MLSLIKTMLSILKYLYIKGKVMEGHEAATESSQKSL